jgi:DNA-directed RNA polymerase subunit K/omega
MDFEVDEPVIEIEDTDSFHDSKEILMNYDKLKKKNKSKPVMSKYERTKIIGTRAQQIASGCQPLIEVPKYITNTLEIAELELNNRKTPFIVKRKVGSNIEYWKIEDLTYLQ